MEVLCCGREAAGLATTSPAFGFVTVAESLGVRAVKLSSTDGDFRKTLFVFVLEFKEVFFGVVVLVVVVAVVVVVVVVDFFVALDTCTGACFCEFFPAAPPPLRADAGGLTFEDDTSADAASDVVRLRTSVLLAAVLGLLVDDVDAALAVSVVTGLVRSFPAGGSTSSILFSSLS